MARLGLTPREFAALVEDRPPIAWRAVISHLACADEPEHPLNAAAARPLRRRRGAVARRTGEPRGLLRHLSRSGASFRSGASGRGAVRRQPAARAGPTRCARLCGFSAKIIQMREIDSGESVGYGAAHVMQAPGRVATVAVGYADGWLRSLSRRGCGYIGGHAGSAAGPGVDGSLLTFDVSAVDPALTRPGMTIELLGPRLRRRRRRGRCRDDRLRDPDRARRRAITASIAIRRNAGMIRFLASVGAAFLAFLAATGRLVAVRRPRRSPACVAPPFYPRADPAPDRLYRLFLAAGGRADRAVHRHGAGAAILYRVQPVQRRERDRDRRRAVGHARIGAGHRRADGGGPGRRRDGGRDRHDARDRADRRADDAVDRPAALSGAAAPAGRAS